MLNTSISARIWSKKSSRAMPSASADARKVAQQVGSRRNAQPQQHTRFNKPSNRDPLRVQLQRNGDSDERDSNGHVQQIDEFGILEVQTIFDGAADAQIDSRQRQRKPGECGFLLPRYMAYSARKNAAALNKGSNVSVVERPEDRVDCSVRQPRAEWRQRWPRTMPRTRR